MSTENDNKNGALNAAAGYVIGPLAILMALLADYGLDFGLVLDGDGMTPFVAIAVAAMLGITPRVLKEQAVIQVSAAVVSLATLVVALIASEAVATYAESNLLGVMFFITMFGG